MRVVIVPYDPEWPDAFRRLAAPMRAALGDRDTGPARRIDHIGSTSVPGLASKNRIDLQITVPDFAPPTRDALIAALAPLGWEFAPDVSADHVPPGREGDDPAEWAKWYFRDRAIVGGRDANLHVRAAGRANQRYPLLFRDYLRAHPAAAEAYARLKRGLSDLAGENRDAYVDTKDPVCDLILLAAEAWAAQTAWTMGEPDA